MSDLEQKPSQGGPVPRKTQRAPVSCAQCAARKVKCDKVFPCKRCISKGMAEQCKREIVVVKGRVVGGEGDDVPRREFITADYEAENKALRKMIRRLTGKLPTREDLHEAALSTPALPTVALPSPSLATMQLEVDNAISRSYSDRTYLKSRQICLESGRAILAERQRVVPALFDRAWHITSDTVAAGIILCAIYREETDPAEKRQLYEDVNGCIQVLAKGGSMDNNLVQIGINLLNNFLKSAGSPPPRPPAASYAARPSAFSVPPAPSFTTAVPPFHPPIHPSIPVFDPSPPSFPSLDPTFSSLPSPPLPSLPHPPGLPLPPPPADAGEFALPDLWSALDFSGERPAGGGFDPFGGWEGAVEFDPSWAGAGAGAAGPGVWMSGLAGEGAAEYDPSKPAALW